MSGDRFGKFDDLDVEQETPTEAAARLLGRA